MKSIFKMNLMLLVAGLMATPAFAAQIKNPKCKDFVTVKDQYAPQYLAVVDGYDKAGKKVDESIDMDGMVTQVDQVKQECAKNAKESLAAARKNVATMPKAATTAPPAKMSGTTSINPAKAQCQEFIALGEQYQPVAAFWVAGHSKTGEAKKGHIDEEYLERPVATLVEDCQSHPTASFYDRAKMWMTKKI